MPASPRDRLAALAVVGFLAAAGRAHGADPGDISDVALEDLLDQHLTAASLREEHAIDAAATAFVLDGEDLRQQGFSTVAEALGTVPGLFSYRDGLYPYVGVRGIGLLGDFTTRLLVLVDGHPVNDSLAIGASHVGRDLPVVLDAVKRIEVVKGPLGGVYGPMAFLGVVNIVTRDPAPRSAEVRVSGDAAQGRVRSGGGSAVVTGIAGDVEVLLAADAVSSRGLDWTFPELAASPDRFVPGGRVNGLDRWDAFNAHARVEANGVRLAAACNRAASGVPSAAYSSLLLDSRNGFANRACFVDVATARPLAPGLTLVGKAAYDWFDFRDDYAYADPPGDVGLVHDLGTDRWLSGEVRVDWEPRSGSGVMTGVRVETHKTVQRTWSDAVPTLLQDPAGGVGVGDIRHDFAGGTAFLAAHLSLPRNVVLHGHATLTVHEMYGARLAPKGAVVWRPDEATALKLVYAEGFRPPLASEAFYEDGLSYVANPDLRPELARSLEASAERRLGRFAIVTASVFTSDYRDLVRMQTVPAPGLAGPPDPTVASDWRQKPVNLAHETVRGGELALQLRWRDAFRAWGGLSAQQVRGAALDDFPELTANLALSGRVVPRLLLAARAAFTSARAKPLEGLDPGVRTSVPASALLDAAVTLELSRELSLQLGVQNLLDAVAPSPVPADFKPITEQPAAARTVRASLRWSARPR